MRRIMFSMVRYLVSKIPRGKSFVINMSLRFLGRAYGGPITVQGLKFWIDDINALNRSLFFLGTYEPESTELIKRMVKSGMRVIDIGSNFGWYTMLMANLVGPSGIIYAFDISSRLIETMNKSAKLNGFQNIIAKCTAIGDHSGNLDFYEDIKAGTANLSQDLVQTSIKRSVPVMKIDDMVPVDWIDFIKCDIDGAEAMFLDGAQKLLSRKPPMLIEIFDKAQKKFGSSGIELKKQLENLGYKLLTLDQNREITEEDIRQNSSLNVLCI